MKNFYNSKLELENKKDRIRILKHDIESLKLKRDKITSSIKETTSTGGNREQSKIEACTIQIIDKEEELKELQEGVNYLTPIIKRMGERVDAMIGLKKDVFEMYYKDDSEVTKIAKTLDYSPQRIYQILDEIKKELGLE